MIFSSKHTSRLGHLSASTWVFAVTFFGLLGCYGACVVARPAGMADGYDGIGFLLSLSRIDLAHFQPHPPGFPLFVLLGKLAVWLGLSPAHALGGVNATLFSLGIAALVTQIERQEGLPPALWLGALVLGSPLCTALAVSTLSDGAAVGAALLVIAQLRSVLTDSGSVDAKRAPACVGGVALATALGLRPQIVLLIGPLLGWIVYFWLRSFWSIHRRAVVVFILSFLMASLLIWLPFVLYLGPRLWWALCVAHARGHLFDFGGTLTLHTPLQNRLHDGALLLASALGMTGCLAVVAALARAVGASPTQPPAAAQRLFFRALLGTAVCYLGLSFFLLPVAASGRHLLPVVVLVCLLCAPALAAVGAHRRLRTGAVLVFLLAAVADGRDVVRFLGHKPPGLRLAAYAAEQVSPSPRQVFGTRAARYVDLLLGPGSALPALYLGEVIGYLERAPHLPQTVLITSEVEVAPASRSRLSELAQFCPDHAVPIALRLDAYAPRRTAQTDPACLTLFSYRVLP